MSKKNPNECRIVLRSNMKPEEITAAMPVGIEIADVLRYTNKSLKLFFPDGCLVAKWQTMRALSRDIYTVVKCSGITGLHRKENLEDGSIIITYEMPTK